MITYLGQSSTGAANMPDVTPSELHSTLTGKERISPANDPGERSQKIKSDLDVNILI
jgi:hypothetical protein